MSSNSLSRKSVQFIKACMLYSDTFSTCAKKKYAAILVDQNGHIVGIGYNGAPKNFLHCEDGGCPRLNDNSPSGSTYDNCIAIHAEQNAFLHSDYSSNPTELYVNGPPCFTCAKLICNSTVNKVFYIKDDSYKNWNMVKDFLLQANVELVEVENNGSW